MKIIVPEEFIWYRSERAEEYNQGSRSDNKFMMDLDCELVEWYKMKHSDWIEHPSWMVDAMTADGVKLDVKFVQKYWNISRQRAQNIMHQYGTVDEYHLYQWVDRPKRPFKCGDECEVRLAGILQYGDVVRNIRYSRKEPSGYFVDYQSLL